VYILFLDRLFLDFRQVLKKPFIVNKLENDQKKASKKSFLQGAGRRA
jgi:hypothetical protein